jgi:predicted nucleotidyltransferase component of viral defense system
MTQNDTPKNIAESIRERLFAVSKKYEANHPHADFNRVLSQYAIERLIYRLNQVEEAKNFVLKGGMLFVTWPEQIFRPTKDLDLLGFGDPSPENVRLIFEKICAADCPEDGIKFDSASLKLDTVRESNNYRGIQLKLNSTLAKAKIKIQVDIGFGDYVHPAPRSGTFPNILEGLPKTQILMYPPETVIAEKLHAITILGLSSTRLKDYYDLWVLIRIYKFSHQVVLQAVRGTFIRRQDQLPTGLPVGLTKTFAESGGAKLWQAFLRRSGAPPNTPLDLSLVMLDLQKFFILLFDSPTVNQTINLHWNPETLNWNPFDK